ncbi:MAG: replication-associated recombination protein A [Planctomycetota bacterium]|nr:MAG: replication-associated recombination protein A [Planctomycetota bacterium]
MDLFPEPLPRESFERGPEPGAPLADMMRPRTLDDFVGQDKLVAEGTPLREMIEKDQVPSLVFWGPPGSGKTTLARIIAKMTGKRFVTLSAVTSGVKDLRRVFETAKFERRNGRGTILFVDEVHRFNKAQQDAFLPHVEDGTITLIGATTENPSFEVIPPLLSRCRVYVLESLSTDALKTIISRTLEDNADGLGARELELDDDAASAIAELAAGDARYALNLLETTSGLLADGGRITLDFVKKAVQKKALLYDKNREEHYNIISALHKALRGSDVQASLYWLGRMLEGGEDPIYVARRLVRFASEDVGNADPQALVLGMSAMQACKLIGMPECDNALAQLVIYLATAPKSNSTYKAYGAVKKRIRQGTNPPVPLHIRNAPTGLMKDLGYGQDYKYPHEYEEGYVAEEYLPEEMQGEVFYTPSKFGFEKEIKKRMDYWAKLKERGNDEE